MALNHSLEDCLRLLKGERDEQRLAGLLLATKFCKGDDNAAILKIYDAIGFRFLDRLLMTGTGQAIAKTKDVGDCESFLQLAVIVLATFCRVVEIAASKDIVSRVPVILDVLSKASSPSIYVECYEILFLISTASEDGFMTLYDSGVVIVLATHMATLPDGSRSFDVAVKILKLIMSKVPLDAIISEYHLELSAIVATLAKQFSFLHTSLKFDLLRLLTSLLSSKDTVPMHMALNSLSSDWRSHVRDGVVAILQNRVASPEKLQALILAESMVHIHGESWLLGQVNLPGDSETVPIDRCLFLVLESSRVEVAVLLNELAYLRYEVSTSSTIEETILLKQQNLAVAFSLIEKIIKLISSSSEMKDNPLSERTLMMVISALNETMGVVLDFLQDAKEHGRAKGDDLVASVRILGSYLAEVPSAFKEKVLELLEYVLSVTGEDESSPFYSICFFLPMLCQITMEVAGCKVASYGAHKSITECLGKLIARNNQDLENDGIIFMACDTLINILQNRETIGMYLDTRDCIPLLQAMAKWTVERNDPSIITMASSICSLIFDFTSEEILVNNYNFDQRTLSTLSNLIARCFDLFSQKDIKNDGNSDLDLHQIVATGYSRWAMRFPIIKYNVQRSQHKNL